MSIKYLFALTLMLMNTAVKAQNLSKAVFHLSDSDIKSYEITVGNIALQIDNKGKLVSFNSIEGGEFDYWTGSGSRVGKIKSIGKVNVDYFINDFEGNRDGKVKFIGDLNIDYWTTDLLSGKQGKLKSIGNISIDYLNDDGTGRLKSFGDINIYYYPTQLLSSNQGKVKSIGNINIDYWPSDLLNSDQGKIKSIKGNSLSIYAVRD